MPEWQIPVTGCILLDTIASCDRGIRLSINHQLQLELVLSDGQTTNMATWIEVRDNHGEMAMPDLEKMNTLAKGLGVRLHYAWDGNDLLAAGDEERFRSCIRKAAVFGSGTFSRITLSADSFSKDSQKQGYSQEEFDRLCNVLRKYEKIAAEYGINLVYENAYEPINGDGKNLFGMCELMRAVPDMKMTFDPGNFLNYELVKCRYQWNEVRNFYLEFKNRIPYIHLKSTKNNVLCKKFILDGDINYRALLSDASPADLICIELPGIEDLPQCEENVDEACRLLGQALVRPANPVRRALLDGKLTIGTWMQIGHPAIAEVLANTGFAWIAADCEHTGIDIEVFSEISRGMYGRGAVAMARVRENDTLAIRQVLDAGAQGVIVPLVNTPDEARRAVAAAKYPPEGVRGFAFCRANNWGVDFDAYARTANRDVAVVVMIESRQAVENIDAILAVEGVDGVFIGPYDMSGSYGIIGQTSHPFIQEACQTVVKACHRHHKAAGLHVVVPTDESISRAIADGFTFIALGIDSIFLDRSARTAIQSVQHTPAKSMPQVP